MLLLRSVPFVFGAWFLVVIVVFGWLMPENLVAANALRLSGTSGIQGQAGYSSEHGYCELCMHTIHQIQYGSLPSCAQSPRTSSSCSVVVQVILAQASAVLQLIEEGCYSFDAYKGWQTVKPCPSHAVCGRLHNTFDVQLATLCPKDFHFRFPTALAQVVCQCSSFQLSYT